MKKKFLIFVGLAVAMLFALGSCTSNVALGSVGGLELETSKAVQVENERWNNIFKLTDGLSALKSDLEERYSGDETFSIKEIGTDALAFTRKRLNKFGKRNAETWLCPVGADEFLYLDVCGRLAASADVLEKDVGIRFWLPVKHMTSPKVLYVNEYHLNQMLAAYENVSYPLSCEFSELKSYYENLGFYSVESDETNQTLTLKLKETDDDVATLPEANFRVAVKIRYEPAAGGTGSVKGYFKAVTEAI